MDGAQPTTGAEVSIIARVVRQFEAPGQLVMLDRVMALPDTPTMGTRLNLRALAVAMCA